MPSFIKRPALFLCVFSACIAMSITASSAAFHSYASFKGKKQGQFKGESLKAGSTTPKTDVHINVHPVTTHFNIK